MKAILQSFEEAVLEKSKGEGSRGGHIIAHTRDSRPIYERSKHQLFTPGNHADAASAHNLAQKMHAEYALHHHDKMSEIPEVDNDWLFHQRMRTYHEDKALHHREHKFYHQKKANKV